MSRPSPTQSATLFAVNTVKKGNDGNKWSVVETTNGTKRWKRFTETVVVSKGVITRFSLPKVHTLKRLGKLPIKSKVVVGETSYAPAKGFSKFGKGDYNVYQIDGNLVLSKKLLTKTSVPKINWTNTNVSVAVDGGTFGFWDMNVIKALKSVSDEVNNKLYGKVKRKRRRKSYAPTTSIPEIFIPENKEALVVQIKHLNDELFHEYGLDGSIPIGALGYTGTGDGMFGCYTDGKDSLMLMGGYTEMELLGMVQEELPGNLEYFKTHVVKKSKKKTKKKSKKSKKSRKKKRLL